MTRLLYHLHDGLPRQAPGSDESTCEALRRLPEAKGRRVLDIGCGPGRSALVLAAEPKVAHVTAIDIHRPYLDHLTAAAAARGLGERVTARRMSMAKMRFAPASFDLVWCEGAAYFLGIRESLEAWRPLLAAGGCAAFTELCWLVPPSQRPRETVEYWVKAYPAMRSSRLHQQTARAAGYRVLGTFALPDRDWWDEYLAPLEARMELLAAEAARSRTLSRLMAESRSAIALYRRHSRSFGYVFHLVSRV
ncbi:MAG: class I SAM-dependent methyltransferase [Acidobacteria bacterium]|nr:class I SAM-dependent methyltransferase [Acidobacteriota bacterium]